MPRKVKTCQWSSGYYNLICKHEVAASSDSSYKSYNVSFYTNENIL